MVDDRDDMIRSMVFNELSLLLGARQWLMMVDNKDGLQLLGAIDGRLSMMVTSSNYDGS